MRLNLNYYIIPSINLSLEDFHNAGLTSQETKDVIESITIPYHLQYYCKSSNNTLRCERTGINNNWCIVNFPSNNPDEISEIVTIITERLKIKLIDKCILKMTKDLFRSYQW